MLGAYPIRRSTKLYFLPGGISPRGRAGLSRWKDGLGSIPYTFRRWWGDSTRTWQECVSVGFCPWLLLASCSWPVQSSPSFVTLLGNNDSRSEYRYGLQTQCQFHSQWSAKMLMEWALRLPAVQTQIGGKALGWLDRFFLSRVTWFAVKKK